MLSAPYPWRTAVEAPLGIILKSDDSILGMAVRAVIMHVSMSDLLLSQIQSKNAVCICTFKKC